MNSGYNYGGVVQPSHPPSHNVEVTEQQVRTYEKFFEPQWGNIQGMPADLKSKHNVVSQGAAGDGIRNDAQAFIDTEGKGDNCYVPPGTYRIEDSITLSKNWTFDRGAVIKRAEGVTMTIESAPAAHLTKIFDEENPNDGAGFVLKDPNVFPEWWGATGGDASVDTPAIKRARDNNVAVNLFITRNFNLNDTIYLQNSKSLLGAGVNTTGFVWVGDDTRAAVSVGEVENDSITGVRISNLRITCPLGAGYLAPTAGLDIVGARWTCKFENLYLRGTYQDPTHGIGIRVRGGTHTSRIKDCYIEYWNVGCQVEANTSSGANSTYLDKCAFMHNQYGVISDASVLGTSNFVMRDCLCDVNIKRAVVLINQVAANISGCRFESNNRSTTGQGEGGGSILIQNSSVFVDGIYITGNDKSDAAFELTGGSSQLFLVSGQERRFLVASVMCSDGSWETGHRVYIGDTFYMGTDPQEDLVLNTKKAYWGQMSNSTSQVTATGSTAHLTFDTTDDGYGGVADASVSDKLKATRAGVYQIDFKAVWDASNTGVRRIYFRHYVNGADTGTVPGSVQDDYPSLAQPFTQHTSALVRLEVGDEIQCRAWQDSGNNRDLTAQKFKMVRIGD